MTKANIYMVTDIETTMRHRIAFDTAWQAIDKHGNEYGRGSHVIREAFQYDVPYFKEKLGHYFDDTYAHQISPASMNEVYDKFNGQVDNFKSAGHKVYFAAYNAAFDNKYLDVTTQKLMGTNFFAVPHDGIFDIWYNWGMTVPTRYFETAELSDKGNYKTSAEHAYRFESDNHEFVERHIAWHDVIIEKDLTTKTLGRKKAMYIASNAKEIKGNVWRAINSRAPNWPFK